MNTHGYGKFGRMQQGKRGIAAAHRVAWEFAHGAAPPRELDVMHTCDNPPCVNPDHLVLGTHKQNMEDAARKGRTARGDRHWSRKHPELLPRGEGHENSKLTDAQIVEIVRRCNAGETQSALAREFGVTDMTVHRWRTGKRRSIVQR